MRNDYYYLKKIEELSIDKSEFTKQQTMIHLVRDVYEGYQNSKIISDILNLCNVSKKTWNSYIYAYQLYKAYQSKDTKKVEA